MLTSRFKLAHPEDMGDESCVSNVEFRLDGTMREYSIKPLDNTDAMTLLDHELGIVKVRKSAFITSSFCGHIRYAKALMKLIT